MNLKIGKSDGRDLCLDPARLIESRLLVTASSGGGKSWLLRKILEAVSEKTQTIVLDTEGEFGSLRERRDMVLAGPSGEVPVDVRSAALLCRRVMELNLSAVIDISELKPSDRRRFVSLFCSTMVDLPRTLWRPCVVAIDETHEFAPEGEKSESTDAVAMMVSKGRKRGFCLLGATQRLAKLNKDVAAELANQFIGRMNLDVDLKRAADILGFGKDRWPELRDLDPGEFFCFGPAVNRQAVSKMISAEVETTHPKPGQGRLAAPPAPSAKIKGVLGELTDLAKKAEEEIKSLNEAKAEIAKLKRELAAKPAAQPDQAAMQRMIAVETAKREKAFQAALKERDVVIDRLRNTMQKAALLLGDSNVADRRPMTEIGKPELPKIDILTPPIQTRVFKAPPSNGDVSKGARKILNVIAQYEDGCDAEQIAVLTGYRSTSRYEYLRQLKSSGYIEGDGPYSATTEGISALGSELEVLPTGRDLQDYWHRRLSGGELKLFEAIIDAHPTAISGDALEAATGYKSTSIYEYGRQLVARKLAVREGGGLRASDNLF